MTTKIARTLFFITVLPLACFSDDNFLPLDHVPEVSPRIPDRLVGLHAAFFVRCTHCQGMTSLRLCRPRHSPGAERVRAMVLAEFRPKPGFYALSRNFHAVHAAKSTQRDALQSDVHPRRTP